MTGLIVLLDFGVGLVARDGSLVVGLRGFVVGGVESLRTDMSESL